MKRAAILLAILCAGCAARKRVQAPVLTAPEQKWEFPDGTPITCYWLNAKQAYFCPTTLPVSNIEVSVLEERKECCGIAGKPYADAAPPMPKGSRCGEPVKFEITEADGSKHVETWLYPCWPEKNAAKCLSGCKGD
jgi:hypothetical protein